MRVHQLLSGAGPQDAITVEAHHFRKLFTEWGWGGEDWAARVAPGSPVAVRPLAGMADAVREAPDDVLLIHHSAAAPGLEELLALPNRKLLHHHNITPAEWLWDAAPVVAAHCAVGRRQLERLVPAASAWSADSSFNADELRALGAGEVTVIPLPIDRDRLGPPSAAPSLGGRGPNPQKSHEVQTGSDRGSAGRVSTVIFVGRLSPHKRQDAVIRAFAAYRSEHDPEARLLLIGDPVTPAYADQLRQLAGRLAPGAVSIESGLSQEQLAERYRSAGVMLCLSAHEGFCVPLAEAFHFGVPVIAAPAGAVPEVAGDAALLVPDQDPAVIAELLRLVLSDGELRDELRRRGQRRLEAFSLEHVAERLRVAVLAAAGATA